MAVKIRLKRIGKKKAPYYRVIVADSRSPRDGRFIEELGSYDPHTDPSSIILNVERAQYWLDQGAQPTETARTILRRRGLMGGTPDEDWLKSLNGEEETEATPETEDTAETEATPDTASEPVDETADTDTETTEETADETDAEQTDDAPEQEDEASSEDAETATPEDEA